MNYARRLAAALASLLMGQQDAVGLVTFDSKPREFIPNRTKMTHLHHILDCLLRTEPGRRHLARGCPAKSRAAPQAPRAAHSHLRLL